MVGNGLPGEPRRAHARHGLGRDAAARLSELGHHLEPPSEEAARFIAAEHSAWLRRRLVLAVVVVVLVALVAGAAVQWFRPMPGPTLTGLATSVRIPGTAPNLPWPSTGETALSVPGAGSLTNGRQSRPVPVGVLSGVLTAYVVLKDHPLATGGVTGPTIKVTARTLATDQTGTVAGQPEVPVTAGESLTELDALEGLLVVSGNDMATLLAVWDAGSTAAFVTKMDADARSLGLLHTSVTAPGGTDGAVVSTPADLVRLAEAAIRIPVLQQIVSLGEVNLPGVGVRYNPNFVLGADGIVGVEAGADTTANGCYLFAAQSTVDGRPATLYGAVLGQSGPTGPTTAAVDAGDALAKAALSDLTAVSVAQTGGAVGQLSAPWGPSTSVVASKAVTVDGWPGRTVAVTSRLLPLTMPVPAGTRIGWLQVHAGSRVVEVALHTTGRLLGPTRLWRLTR